MATGILSRLAVAASNIDFGVKKLLGDMIITDTVAGTGTVLADAAPLTAGRNAVTLSDGTVGVRLPKALKDTSCEIINTVSNQTMKVWPNVAADQINAITAGDPFSLVGGARGQFYCDADGHWYVAAANLTGTSTSATTAQLDTLIRTSRIVDATGATLTVTEALHNDRTIVLDRAAGIAVTLPVAAAGLKFRFIVKTTFSGAATIKSVAGADIMVGHALMGNNSDNTVVDWQTIAADTNDTIDLFGTANSTGGMAGQEIGIEGLAANLWFVNIRGDAAGTEATPFANTVA
ncbi:MAG: hypothetical protein NUV51_11045 [Sulfuricaulis sp.]|nr:hypothetical protein [Sulfuricaulis sp.]